MQLHVEQLLLKMTWNLAEQLFYNKGYKERYTQSLVGWKEKWSGWDPHPFWVYPEEEEDIMGSGIFPGEGGVCVTY